MLTKQDSKSDSENYNLDHFRKSVKFMHIQMNNLFKKGEKKTKNNLQNYDLLRKKQIVLELERWILKK